MAPIADSDGVRLPKDMTKEDKAEYDKLASLSGDDFDKEYITLMVKDHRKDMREFRQESMSTPDPTLKDAIEKGQTVIREHLKAINKIAADKGIVVPGGRKPPTPQPAPAQ
jgi:putative membrane protein